jgi:hypothetical protein
MEHPMPTSNDITNPDIANLMEALAERAAGPLTLAVAELAQLMAKSTNVREVPSARIAGDSITLPQNIAVQILGQQPDRKRVTLWIASGTTPAVYISSRLEDVKAGTGSAKLMATGTPLVLDTTAPIAVMSTGGTDAVLSWLVEETDLPRGS